MTASSLEPAASADKPRTAAVVPSTNGIRRRLTASIPSGGLPRALVLLLGIAAAVIAVAGIKAIAWLVGPVFLALIIVIAAHPVQRWLRGRGWPGWVFIGNSVGLSATVTFVTLLFWAWVLGPLGALLAIPLTLLAKALLVDVDPRARWADALLRTSAEEPDPEPDAESDPAGTTDDPPTADTPGHHRALS